MALLSAQLCRERIAMWLEAEAALSTGQSYAIAGRNLTRVNLDDVMQQIRFWKGQLDAAVAAETGIRQRPRMKQYVPTDQ